MKKLLKIGLLLVIGIGVDGIGAQDGNIPTDPWRLAAYRPVVGVQFCENPVLTRSMPFDGTTEECKAEFDRLFVKCTTELPNVRLPSKFNNREEQGAAIALLYECISSHYIGGASLEEFNSRHVPQPQSDNTSSDEM